MKEIRIEKNHSGQRLDKFLQKYLKEASKSFLYKMLRKKNIKLNGKKAQGNEMLAVGDVVSLFFADETLEKFRGRKNSKAYPVTDLDILYEDEHVVLINKPAGILSQKAKKTDVTLVEYYLGYLQREKKWQPDQAFTPGICNRLDRNTSGIVIGGKSLAGLQKMSEILKERTLDKYYLTIVEGVMKSSCSIGGYLQKDKQINKVSVFQEAAPGRSRIETAYQPLMDNGKYTLLRVKLITGKTHQIRSHLSSIGHPLMGDVKYMGRKVQGLENYFLHAQELCFPKLPEPFEQLSRRVVNAPLPKEFEKMKIHLFGK